MIKAASMAAAAPLFVPAGLRGFELNPMQSSAQKIKRFGDERDWFFEKRYGMFVHWGIYSIPAWHEQHQWRARVPRQEYVKLAGKWNPKKFDPVEWLDTLEMAGMKYITITTKHHDGFCLWDTHQTRFNTMNTPYNKDIIGMLSLECHKRNVPLCLYYSVVDWNHPSYPNQGRSHELPAQPGDTPDWDAYLEFLKAQVKELCTNYGKISGFWWDMNVTGHKDPAINNMIRSLQPSAVINNRGFDEGDFGTPERDFENADARGGRLERPTEACQSVGMESWGYRKDEDYYSDLHLEKSIDKYLSRNANYLLNVGPTAEGTIPDESYLILERLGEWYHAVKESYENVEFAPDLLSGKDAMVTVRDNVMYLHFNKELTGAGFKMKPFTESPVKATLLNNNSKVDFTVDLVPSEHADQKKYLRLKNLPVNEMAGSVMVVKLQFREKLPV
jgi:alpha-L-fucosidase